MYLPYKYALVRTEFHEKPAYQPPDFQFLTVYHLHPPNGSRHPGASGPSFKQKKAAPDEAAYGSQAFDPIRAAR
jgi:hypothetical protein